MAAAAPHACGLADYLGKLLVGESLAEEFGTKINSMEKESHRISNEPQKIPFKLLAEITDGFSEKAKIGSGAFGQVYKGVLKDGTEIAVKKLHFIPGGFDNKQFENELSHLKRLKHENIVQIVGFCDETEQVIVPYEGRLVVADIIHRLLCLEFVPNGSLGKILSEKFSGHNWNVRFKIIKGVSVGLKYLHDSGIMHFDLKPDNILLDEKMVPKIADFGISRLAAGESNTISTMTRLGTPGFMPPEFINKQIISKQFDIFSLGVIIKRIVVSGLSDYMSIADMEGQALIKHVHDSWEKLQETSSYASLEVDSKQVRTCIEIAVVCMEADRYKRHTMQDIMCKLKEVETTEVGDSRSRIEEIHMGDIPKTQYPGKAVSIHKEASSEMPTGASGSLVSVPAGDLPSKFLNEITSKFLNEITEGFSSEQVIATDAFGTYYKGVLEGKQVILVKKIGENSLLPPRKQFESEVNNLMVFMHENIVRLLGYCHEAQKKVIQHNGRYILVEVVERYLCYEYVQNGSLGKYIFGESRIDWATCFKIIKGICQGLYVLHCTLDRPLVHMNLMPDNIWLDDNMVPKIVEFALSRLFGEEQTRMFSQNVVGSLGYMAPEYLYRGEISMQSDIYSLGLIIMEITTGEKNMLNKENMAGRNFIENVRQNWTSDEHIASKYPSLDVDSLHQVKECITIGLRCVEIDRKKRPSITEILDVLQPLQ
ncbi:receptor like protein kinase S.2-like, partial [Miscanthus floridulus]|uniref:receptor like protein kinase S.2-like n=1 Tax=Miscanthus floridulus TaxID=154761 RepID=UPI00345AD9DB